MESLKLKSINFRELGNARIQIHHAIQLIPACARAFLETKSDDSHTNLIWDATQGAFVSQALPGLVQLGYRVRENALFINEDACSIHAKRIEDLVEWTRTTLGELGLEGRSVQFTPPYSLPSHPVAEGAPISLPGLEYSSFFSQLFQMASDHLQEIQLKFQSSEPRCWPHHFDLSTRIQLSPEKTITVGMSPGDDFNSDPYFYVSPWPYPTRKDFPKLTQNAFWNQDGFTAAVYRAAHFCELSAKQQPESIQKFLLEAVQACQQVLST